MTGSDWIICERTGRWAAALRVGMVRQASTSGRGPRLYEVRSLEELAEKLAVRRASLALLEVHHSNLSNVVTWLANSARHFPRAHFVALLDRSLSTAASSDDECWPADLQDVAGALLEAGAAEIADSPRCLQQVFTIAEMHAETGRQPHWPHVPEQSIVDWAWSQLP